MTRTRTRCPAIAGFTLIELLVAIALLSILLAALFGGLRLGMRSDRAATARIDRSSDIVLLYGFLQKELGGALRLDRDGAPVFAGESDALRFVTTAPDHFGLGGFQVIAVRTVTEARTRALVASWQPVSRGAPGSAPPPPRPSVLLDRLKSVQFSFFGAPAANRSPEWLDRWQERSALPLLVRARVVLDDGWRAPDLVIALRLAGPGS